MMRTKASSQPLLSSSATTTAAAKKAEPPYISEPSYKDQVRAVGWIQFKDQTRDIFPSYKDQVQPVDNFGRPTNLENQQAPRSSATTAIKSTSLLSSSMQQQQQRPLPKMHKEPNTALKAKSFSGRKAEPEYEKSKDSRTTLSPLHYHNPTTKEDLSRWSSPASSPKKDIVCVTDDDDCAPTFKSHRTTSNKGIPITNVACLAIPETTTNEPENSSVVSNANMVLPVAATPRAVPSSMPHSMVEKKSTSPSTRNKQQHLPSINEGNACVFEDKEENKSDNPQCPCPPKAFIVIAIMLQILLIVVIASLATTVPNFDHCTETRRVLQQITESPSSAPTVAPTLAPTPAELLSNTTTNSTRPISNITDSLNISASPSPMPSGNQNPSSSPSKAPSGGNNSKSGDAISCSIGIWVGIALLLEVLLCAGLYLYYHFWKSSRLKSNEGVSSPDAPSSIYREPTAVAPAAQVRYVEESMIQWDHNLNPILDEENGDDNEDVYPYSVVSVAHPR
jgi:hypothetical protein